MLQLVTNEAAHMTRKPLACSNLSLLGRWLADEHSLCAHFPAQVDYYTACSPSVMPGRTAGHAYVCL